MATYIRIAGVDVERVKGSLSITKVLRQRAVASFVVVDRTGAANYYRGQAVDIFTGLAIPPFIHPQFSGFIDYPRRQRISPTGNALYWYIQCVDNQYLADKRIAAESYATPGQTAGDIVLDLFTKYLQAEGVTVGDIQAGPTIAEMVINYSSVSKAFDTLAARSDFIWQIDIFKRLYFITRGTTVAPFSIVATDFDIVRHPAIASSLAEASPFYRNRQYIRAGQDVTILQTETRQGDGKAVAFTMGYPIAREPVVTINPPAAAQTIGIKGIDTAKQVYWNKGDAVITFTTAPLITDVVECKYYGLYDIMVQVDSIAEQLARQGIEGGTGIVEALDDLPSIETKDDALDAAIATLNHYGVIGKQFAFPIRKWGLEPGQMVTVTHAPYDLNADELLVEQVAITEVAPGELEYMISAIEGPELGDWTGFFKALADMKADIMERITVGKDQVLIILAKVDENWVWAESVTETVYACPVVDPGLFPAIDLYPC